MTPDRLTPARALAWSRKRTLQVAASLYAGVSRRIREVALGKPGRAFLTDRGLAGMSLALLLLVLLNAALGLRSIAVIADNEASVSHTRAVQTQILLLQTTLVDAETGERGYILTGDETYLQPYLAARAKLDGELTQFQALVSDNPTQLARLAQLRPLIATKMNELQQTIELRKQGQVDQATAIIHNDLGLKTMDSIRALLNDANDTENVLLTQRDASTQRALHWAVFTLILTTILLISFVAATYILARRLLAQRERVAVERAQLLAAEREARATAEAATESATAAVRLRDQFLSIASHELRTPLTVMLTNTQLLERRLTRELENGERFHPAIAGVQRQINRMRALIEAMLDVSRIESGQLSIVKRPVDIVELVRTLARDTQTTSELHAIRLEVPSQPVYVEADAVRLEQVAQNLISNAIKYSPEGGPVWIRVSTATQDKEQVAEISVTDEGIGIAPEALGHLFDRYYRAPGVTSEHISGMGIGLYVVREIVGLHGGEISVTSTPGAGSTFIVRLPLLASVGETAEETPPSKNAMAARESSLPGPV